jgi:glycosyltransferase involved in cell wall biosynthesis
VRIAIVVSRSLRGSGYATRISAMIEAYAARGNEVDLFHCRLPHDEELPSSLRSLLGRYVTVPVRRARYRQHLTSLPPLAWNCSRALAGVPIGPGTYDVVQSEASSAWCAARAFPAKARIAVLHDDDSTRLRGLAKTASGIQRIVSEVSAVKYSLLQRMVLEEADSVWFVSEIERDRLATRLPPSRTRVVPNGAPDELWSIEPPDHGSSSEVLFVGPGSYAANRSGLAWFMKEVWPLVRARVHGSSVRVVGVGWEGSSQHPDASFVGWRESLTHEYARTRVVIAPLFAGGGTKLKVVEGMAAGRPIVTTFTGAEGVPGSEGLRVCEDPEGFASEVVRYLVDGGAAAHAGAANRTAVDALKWSSIWMRATSDLEELAGARS